MNLFSELKRRNVVRVGVAYLVVGWLLSQVAVTLEATLNLPDWFDTFIVAVLIIGLPIALFLSWAYELTPEGMKKTGEVDADASNTHNTGQKLNYIIIAVLVAALAYTQWDSDEPSETVVEVADIEKSIAVLPFANMSEDASNEYFADGLSEELLNVLAQWPDLKVAGRTSSFQFKGLNKDLRDIGRKLGVAHILEGSVRKQESRVRITAQLIRASDGFHIWSDTYDRDLEDIFAVQDEIASAIARELAVQLDIDGANLVPASTNNIAAYERYLEARTYLSRRINFYQAISLLEEATALDPEFAAAWALLGQVHVLSYYYLDRPAPEARVAAIDAAEQALLIDPDLALAHSVKADVLRDQFHWREAEAAYLRALELNPDEVEINSQYAQLLSRSGYEKEALSLIEKTVVLDPLSWLNNFVLALRLDAVGDLQKAREALDRTLELSVAPSPYLFQAVLSFSLRDKKPARALDYLISTAWAGERNFSTTDVKNMADKLERIISGDSANILVEIRDEYNLSENRRLRWPFVSLSVYLGDLDLAAEILKAAYDKELARGFYDPVFLSYAYWRPLNSDPRVTQILHEIGLIDFWYERGPSDRCGVVTDPAKFTCGDFE